jgi:hypothetical protein
MEEARATWLAGRKAWVAAVRSSGLARLVEAAAEGPPAPAVFHRLGRLTLIERLLSRSQVPAEEPLYPPGEDPGLERALARGLAVRFEPLLDGRDGTGLEATSARARAALGASGASLRVLRPLADLVVPDGPGQGMNSRFRLQNPAGERHDDPAGRIPAFVSDAV